MEIRKCKKEDLDEIYELERLSFQYPYPKIIFYDYLDKLFFVIEIENKVIGYVIADDKRNLVISIAVYPDYRRKGYGTMLMHYVLKFMRGKIVLQVRKNNEIAIAFYKRLGFEKIKETRFYYLDGEDAVVMSRRID